MKRILSLLLVLAALCSFGLAFAQEDAAAEIPAAVQEIPAEETEAEPAADGLSSTAQILFSSLAGKEFLFSSGAGAWAETLTVNADGTFSGETGDSDGGTSTEWMCKFTGTFDNVTKISDYEYTMRVATLNAPSFSSYTVYSYTVRYTEPYGIKAGDTIRVYLPGMKVSSMSSNFTSWITVVGSIGNSAYFQDYGLYNRSSEYEWSCYFAKSVSAKQSGWSQDSSGNWYYYVDYSQVKDTWKKIGGSWYYFGSDGKMYSNQWCGNYYLQSGGTMAKGWCQIDGSWYYFNSSGYKQTGWKKISNTWYYLGTDGRMYSSEWYGDYYLKSGGAMAKGWCQIDGSWYYFNSSGYKQTGWKKISNTWYYLGTDGRMYSSEWYGDYYLQSGGAMARGWCKIDGNWYYFNSSGYKQTGWEKISGRWYYLDPENDGIMVYSQTMTIDGTDYTFNSSGCWVG